MNNTTNKIEPLLIDNPIIVLSDGETFDSLSGAMIAFPSDEIDTDEIEEALREDSLKTFILGAHNPSYSIKDISKILKVLMPSQNIEYNSLTDKIRIG